MDTGTSNDRESFLDADERQRLEEHAEILVNLQDEFHSKGVQRFICITNIIKIFIASKSVLFLSYQKVLKVSFLSAI